MEPLLSRYVGLELTANESNQRWARLDDTLNELSSVIDATVRYIDNDAPFFRSSSERESAMQTVLATQTQQQLQGSMSRIKELLAALRANALDCAKAQDVTHANVTDFIYQAVDAYITTRPAGRPMLAPGQLPEVNLVNPTLGADANDVPDDAPLGHRIIINPI
jgi:hypothetical protein